MPAQMEQYSVAVDQNVEHDKPGRQNNYRQSLHRVSKASVLGEMVESFL